MVEVPQAGFTGTVWDAVPVEQLTHELTTGPGIGPMADAGLAYTALAAGLGAAAAEYRAILAVVGNAWGSHSNEDGLAQLGQLADWLDEITTAAQHNAGAAAQQAVSYEIAQLAMPHLTEVTQALHTAEDMIRGSLLGAPLAGLLDTAEDQLDQLREHAAQVMRTYEAASEKLAVPWQQDPAPAVSAGAALLAEQAPTLPGAGSEGPPSNAQAVQQPTLQPAQPIDLSALHIAPPNPTVMVSGEQLVLTPVLPTIGAIAPGPVAAPLVTAAPVSAAPPILPPATTELRSPPPLSAARALSAAAGEVGDRIVVDAGFATAPAVLGGANNRAVPVPDAAAVPDR
ncbi:PPE domain-containing protein [Nocardia sp. SYP-A9097]|uniref:PPE domain-containing protein n=1 Tax=Nocardia sp. SYP-A9097 TaxID=2663237 RepID=UPI00129BB62D|nr:PPE domain-containing protein [Nocardia sp. SYP-A9097]MRH89370.1 PPE domain-containing protein [Nocardia sp. SYP-A9097]